MLNRELQSWEHKTPLYSVWAGPTARANSGEIRIHSSADKTRLTKKPKKEPREVCVLDFEERGCFKKKGIVRHHQTLKAVERTREGIFDLVTLMPLFILTRSVLWSNGEVASTGQSRSQSVER